MNTRLLKETFLIDEKAVRSTGQLGKVGRELLCCLISAGNSNAGILTIKQVSTISHASPYLSSKISRLLYLISWRSYSPTESTSTISKLDWPVPFPWTADTKSCPPSQLSFTHVNQQATRVDNFHSPGGWSDKSDSASCTAFQDLLSLGTTGACGNKPVTAKLILR